ncbi:hypothetical protein VTI74DRAFT_472 [Chaetomium olivicolor]
MKFRDQDTKFVFASGVPRDPKHHEPGGCQPLIDWCQIGTPHEVNRHQHLRHTLRPETTVTPAGRIRAAHTLFLGLGVEDVVSDTRWIQQQKKLSRYHSKTNVRWDVTCHTNLRLHPQPATKNTIDLNTIQSFPLLIALGISYRHPPRDPPFLIMT